MVSVQPNNLTRLIKLSVPITILNYDYKNKKRKEKKE